MDGERLGETGQEQYLESVSDKIDSSLSSSSSSLYYYEVSCAYNGEETLENHYQETCSTDCNQMRQLQEDEGNEAEYLEQYGSVNCEQQELEAFDETYFGDVSRCNSVSTGGGVGSFFNWSELRVELPERESDEMNQDDGLSEGYLGDVSVNSSTSISTSEHHRSQSLSEKNNGPKKCIKVLSRRRSTRNLLTTSGSIDKSVGHTIL